jgi:hypothetical protein
MLLGLEVANHQRCRCRGRVAGFFFFLLLVLGTLDFIIFCNYVVRTRLPFISFVYMILIEVGLAMACVRVFVNILIRNVLVQSIAVRFGSGSRSAVRTRDEGRVFVGRDGQGACSSSGRTRSKETRNENVAEGEGST